MFDVMAMTAARMKEIVDELSSRDKNFADAAKRFPLCRLGQREVTASHFESLVESVVSQQLSVKAADTIYGRVVTLVGGQVTPQSIANAPEEKLRQAGLSGAKLKTIRGLADATLSERIRVNELHEIEDDELVVSQLTSLWGIGSWTVDMFMMSQLGRLDIWPTGDVGVRRGWQKINVLNEPVDEKALHAAGTKFAPYRSVVAWYCWQAADE